VEGDFTQIYKTDRDNAVIFSTHNGLPCIFAVSSMDFRRHHLVFEKRAKTCPCSTMTISEDEDQKKLYHKEKMSEIYDEFEKYYNDGKLSGDAIKIILRIILPDPNE